MNNRQLMIDASRFRSKEEKRSCIKWVLSTFIIGLLIVAFVYS
ncbi:putative membrane protein [Klebsiella phage Muenster]|nr:putative membrane protein [Klebsiella phage Muenster]